MRRIAIYGKGGIGKSTTTSNISAALAEKGFKVLQIGCDPKSDSTRLLLNGNESPSVLARMRDSDDIELNEVVAEGYNGVLCVECGGPKPGTGCAGRGIIAAFELLEKNKAVDIYDPDVIIYDVLGDVVCGGFAMPIRNGYARDVFIVTSGEMMSLFAANNIVEAVRSFEKDGYAKVAGLIQNSRNVPDEDAIVDKAAKEMKVDVLYRIPRDSTVQDCESNNKTVIEGSSDSELAAHYRRLAEIIVELTDDFEGGMRLV